MKVRLLSLVAGICLIGISASGAETKPPKGFTAMFNGKDLGGLHGVPRDYDVRKILALDEQEKAAFIQKQEEDFKKHWTVEKDELVNDGNGPYATDYKNYGDIELLLEYKTVALADSGIYLRGTPQVQIWDTTKEGGKQDIGADKGSGGLYNNKK